MQAHAERQMAQLRRRRRRQVRRQTLANGTLPRPKDDAELGMEAKDLDVVKLDGQIKDAEDHMAPGRAKGAARHAPAAVATVAARAGRHGGAVASPQPRSG